MINKKHQTQWEWWPGIRLALILLFIAALLSAVIGAILSEIFTIPFWQSTILGLIFSILVDVIILNVENLGTLRITILERFQDAEERILTALGFVLGSKELSEKVQQNIILPLTIQVIENRGIDLSDKLILEALVEPMDDFKSTLETLMVRGLKVRSYSKWLTNLLDWADEIMAVSLLIPSAWFEKNGKISTEIAYLQKQVVLKQKGSLRNVKRIFVYDRKYENETAWNEMVTIHQKGDLNIGRVYLENRRIQDKFFEKGDFVIFAKGTSIRILYSPTVLPMLIGNELQNLEDFLLAWDKKKDHIDGWFLFTGGKIDRFVECFKEVEEIASC